MDCDPSVVQPDFSPYDFWLFPTLKHGQLSGKFAEDAEVIKELTALPNQIAEKEFWTKMLTKWSERMVRCLARHGHYFEIEWDMGQDSHSDFDGIWKKVFVVFLVTFSGSGWQPYLHLHTWLYFNKFLRYDLPIFVFDSFESSWTTEYAPFSPFFFVCVLYICTVYRLSNSVSPFVQGNQKVLPTKILKFY